MRIAIALVLALALAGAAFAESNNLDAVCSATGHDYGIAFWQYKQDTWTQESPAESTGVTVTGTNQEIEWTSTVPVAGVEVNAASEGFAGGMSGIITPENGKLNQLYFCGDEPTDVPEFGAIAAGLVMIAGIGLIVMRRK